MTPNLLLTLDLARFTRRDAAAALHLPLSLTLSLPLTLAHLASSRLVSLSHTIGALINYTARCANSSIKIIISCCGCCCGQNVDCCRIYVSHGLLAARAEQLTLACAPSLSRTLSLSFSISHFDPLLLLLLPLDKCNEFLIETLKYSLEGKGQWQGGGGRSVAPRSMGHLIRNLIRATASRVSLSFD